MVPNQDTRGRYLAGILTVWGVAVLSVLALIGIGIVLFWMVGTQSPTPLSSVPEPSAAAGAKPEPQSLPQPTSSGPPQAPSGSSAPPTPPRTPLSAEPPPGGSAQSGGSAGGGSASGNSAGGILAGQLSGGARTRGLSGGSASAPSFDAPAPPAAAAPPSPSPPPPPSLLPGFPWPPPTGSAAYVLPDSLFSNRPTIGDVTNAILSALEQSGYVERSFFQTPPGGVALVTRLERINADGSPAAATTRWPASENNAASNANLLKFLSGLFYVDAGHYRVIVFILQDMPFVQSGQAATEAQAHAWLNGGANVLPPSIAQQPFKGGHCTALIYEFASDGKTVQLVGSALTGKEHLEKAGVLSSLAKAN